MVTSTQLFPDWLAVELAAHVGAARSLWLELPEAMALRYLESYEKLCALAKRFNCKTGTEHVGNQLSEIGQPHDVGLDYLKADASFVRELQHHSASQNLPRTLRTEGHSIGALVMDESAYRRSAGGPGQPEFQRCHGPPDGTASE